MACSPIGLPFVSSTTEMKPNSPIAIFGRQTWPPAGTTRLSSMAQSSQLKYTMVPPLPGSQPSMRISAPPAPTWEVSIGKHQ
jgi:hypothetical protein